MADVNLTLADGGSASVSVPATSVQVVIGCSSLGAFATPVATRSLTTLQTTYGYGPLVENAAIKCLSGGTVIAMRAAVGTAGSIRGSGGSTLAITGTTGNAVSPIVVTTLANTLATGQIVTITGTTGNTAANGNFAIVALTATTFSLVGTTGNGAWVSGGTVAILGSSFVGTGTSVPLLTGAPFDDTFVKLKVIVGGTIGVAGITFQYSIDAGRNYGPVTALPLSGAYTFPNQNVTVTFGAGTLVALDVLTFGTIAPAPNNAGITACLVALQASPYAVSGWGSIDVVGAMAGADDTAIAASLATLATGQIYTHLIMHSRDSSPPIIYGGTAETDAVHTTAVALDYSAVGNANTQRTGVSVGFYNMNSAYPILGTAFRMRRPLSWSWAARQVAIATQTHAGRVSDGALAQVIVDPVNDPQDGFVYHDERNAPGMTALRFCAAKTRVRMPGYWIDQPNLMAQVGSQFTIWPLGVVMDVGCTILTTKSTLLVNSDVRLNANGTIYDAEAAKMEASILQAINDNMTAYGMLSQAGPGNSGAVVSVDRTNNVRTQKAVNITTTLYSRGYIFTINDTIGFAT